MNLELIKNVKEKSEFQLIDTSEVRFKFFKNMIKKDLEVLLWSNQAVKFFGEFQIFSDFRSELNSFEYIVSLQTGKDVSFPDESLECHISGVCSEYVLNLMIQQEKDLKKPDVEMLSLKLTEYLLEATETLIGKMQIEARVQIMELNKKYFNENDPTFWKYINPKYLN